MPANDIGDLNTALAANAGGPRIAAPEAAAAAGERGDEKGRIEMFKQLAAQGDGRAALTVGLSYFNGDTMPRDAAQAYRWFHVAWSLDEPEGLNGLGPMWRDGIGVTAHPMLAQSAFYLASTMAKTDESLERAQRNLQSLDGAISGHTKRAMACQSLGAFDAQLKRPVSNARALPTGLALKAPQRRLGEIVPELATHYQPSGCRGG